MLRVGMTFVLLALTGCSALDSFFLRTPEGGGSTADTVGQVASSLGSYGLLVSGALGIAGTIYVGIRSAQIRAQGKKDDDRNGVPDDTEVKA